MLKTRRLFLKGAAVMGIGALVGSAGCMDNYTGGDTVKEKERLPAVRDEIYRVYMAAFNEFDAEITEDAYRIDEENTLHISGTVTNTSPDEYENVVLNGNTYDDQATILGHDEDDLGGLTSGKTTEYALTILDDGVASTVVTRYGLYVTGDKFDSQRTTTERNSLILSVIGRYPSQ